jgi:hypothetical protein
MRLNTIFLPHGPLYTDLPRSCRATAHSCFKSFTCNTCEPSRKCCKQKTYVSAKSLRCNTYKKHGEGVQLPNS